MISPFTHWVLGPDPLPYHWSSIRLASCSEMGRLIMRCCFYFRLCVCKGTGEKAVSSILSSSFLLGDISLQLTVLCGSSFKPCTCGSCTDVQPRTWCVLHGHDDDGYSWSSFSLQRRLEKLHWMNFCRPWLTSKLLLKLLIPCKFKNGYRDEAWMELRWAGATCSHFWGHQSVPSPPSDPIIYA